MHPIKSPLTSAVNPNATGIFGTRGDELSTITLTIHQKPKKNLLTFQFNKQETDNLIDFCKLGLSRSSLHTST